MKIIIPITSAEKEASTIGFSKSPRRRRSSRARRRSSSSTFDASLPRGSSYSIPAASSTSVSEAVPVSALTSVSSSKAPPVLYEGEVVSRGGGGSDASTLSSASVGSNVSAIKVVTRVRPLNQKEIESKSTVIVNVAQSSIQVINPFLLKDPAYQFLIPSPSKQQKSTNSLGVTTAELLKTATAAGEVRTFHFDRCYSADFNHPMDLPKDIDEITGQSNQRQIFEEIGTEMIDSAFQGFNCTVLAYGQTGAGKTHTMLGEKTSEMGKGLIPRVCEALFQGIEKCRLNEEQQQQQNTTSMNSSVLLPIKTIYSVQVNYFEIYKEKVHDLLETSTGNATTNKKVREHPQTGPFVEGLISRSVNSYTEIEEQMLAGEKLRTVASTLMNATSSRSHAIFTITFTQTTVDPTSQVAHDKTSKICMIDLAGSERADVSGTSGERLKEGSMINKSLTTLGRVISALSKNSNERVPYRDSILTWLLKESLGGNAKTTMIAMVSPAAENYEETMSTLRYAESAKKVMNRAIINEDCNAKIIRQLREEIVSLRIELAKATRAPSVSISTTITTLPSPVAAADAKRDEMLPGIYASLNEREQALEQLQAKSEKVSENDINTGKKHRLVLDSSFPSLINIKSSIKPNEPLAWTLGQGTNVITYRRPEALQTDDNTDDQYHYICLESQGKVSESDVIKIIYEEKDSLSLEWLNSSVPVSVNGKPLEENLMGVRFAICHRDVLLIGGTMYALRIYIPGQHVDDEVVTIGPSTVPTMTDNLSVSSASLPGFVQEANALCDALNMKFTLRYQEPIGDDLGMVQVLLSNGKKSCVNWMPEIFMERLSQLRLLATSLPLEEEQVRSPSLTRVDPALELETKADLVVKPQLPQPHPHLVDPFFDLRSNAIRLLGNARVYYNLMDPTATSTKGRTGAGDSSATSSSVSLFASSDQALQLQQGVPKIIQAAVYDANGHYVAALQVEMDYFPPGSCVNSNNSSESLDVQGLSATNAEESKGRGGLAQLKLQKFSSSRGAANLNGNYPDSNKEDVVANHNKTHGLVRLRLKQIEFFAGIYSEGLYLTYHQESDNKKRVAATSNRPQCIRSTPKVTLHQSSSTGRILFKLDHAIWQRVSSPSALSIQVKNIDLQEYLSMDVWGFGNMCYVKQNASSSPSRALNSIPYTTSMSLASRVDVFFSVDIEERGEDGIFQRVSVKKDGSLRLQQNRARRLVVNIVQADHQTYCLKDVVQVRVCELTSTVHAFASSNATTGPLKTQGTVHSASSKTLPTPSSLAARMPTNVSSSKSSNETSHTPWVTLPFRTTGGYQNAEVNENGRSLTAVLRWEQAFGSLSEQIQEKGKRQVLNIILALETKWSKVPVVLSKSVLIKMCPQGTKDRSRVWWARETFSRHQRLGAWYAIDITKDESIDPVVVQKDIEEDIEQMQCLLIAEKLLDQHGKGIHLIEKKLQMEFLRQQLLLLTSTGSVSLNMNAQKEIYQTTLASIFSSLKESPPNFYLKCIKDELYLVIGDAKEQDEEGIPSKSLMVNLFNGAFVMADNTTNSTNTCSTDDGPSNLSIAHFVTNTNGLFLESQRGGRSISTLPIGKGEIAGFLMVLISSNLKSMSSSKAWKRRWFVLQRPFLYCYKTFAKTKQIGVMDISKCQVIVDAMPSMPFTFQLVVSHSENNKQSCLVWHIHASTQAEMRAWLVAIDPLKIDAREAVIAPTTTSNLDMPIIA